MQNLKVFVLTAILGLSLFSCSDDDPMMPDPQTDQTILDIVVDGSDFTLLEAAVIKVSSSTDLVSLFSDASQSLTVFAPTDAAFQAAGFADTAAINAADTDELLNIILYHALGSEVPSSAISPGAQTTENGQEIYLSVNGSDIFINGNTQVTTADQPASNGVIHIINQVLIPPSQDIVEIASALSTGANPEFTALVAALGQANLVSILEGDGPFTVFAPTDAAFNEFLGQLGLTLSTVPPALLEKILLYHVVSARAFSPDLVDASSLPTANNGATVNVNLQGGVFIESLNSSEVTLANVLATNGVIHQINKVLVPIADFTITQVAQVGDNFTLLETAVLASQLDNALSDTTANLTVFAPDDAAFAATNLDLASLGNLTQSQ
ncbi:MAG: fasciclin domain-containing protein, partial [Bacteroidota bacterium]